MRIYLLIDKIRRRLSVNSIYSGKKLEEHNSLETEFQLLYRKYV